MAAVARSATNGQRLYQYSTKMKMHANNENGAGLDVT
jgi:hypothetical protein